MIDRLIGWQEKERLKVEKKNAKKLDREKKLVCVTLLHIVDFYELFYCYHGILSSCTCVEFGLHATYYI